MDTDVVDHELELRVHKPGEPSQIENSTAEPGPRFAIPEHIRVHELCEPLVYSAKDERHPVGVVPRGDATKCMAARLITNVQRVILRAQEEVTHLMPI